MSLKYTLHLSSILFLTLSLSSCKEKKDKPDPTKGVQKKVVIDALVIKPQAFSSILEASGSVLANEFVELKPDINGRVVQLNIREGQQVNEGTLLAKLFDDDLQAQLRKNQSALEIAVKNEQRLNTLLKASGLNQQDYDQALTSLNSAKADLDYTKAQIRKTEIRAPFTGLIGLRNVSIGAYVSSANVLATLQQVNILKIDFVVPESNAKDIHVGGIVKIKSDEINSFYSAQIAAIEPQVNTGSRNIKARAILSDRAAKLSPGAFVNVQIEQGKTNSAILVPTNCIIPESRNKKVVVIKNGKAQFQIVKTGFRNDSQVEIKEGISLGDTIALNGILYLKPDAAVSLRSVK